MSDRSIRELDLKTDSVLPEDEKADIYDLFYKMRDCLSTHDNPSVHCKATVSLNPVNLKPFYIKPYLTHEKEIKFGESELKNIMTMGILCRGSSEFLSPIMLIKKSHSGSTLGTAPEYILVVDFMYLNSHLPDVKLSYPEVKHILNKIDRSSANIFSVVDLKSAFHSINLSEDSKKFTGCCASPGSPTYIFNRMCQGLKPSPALWTSLMGDILADLPEDVRESIECIMDDLILFTSNIKHHKRVLKCLLHKLRDFGLLLTITKIHIFRSRVKYMGLMISSKNGLPIISPLGSRIKAISNLPIPITARGIKSFIGCVIFLAQFLPKRSELIKPINDILKKSNKLHKVAKISPLLAYGKGKGAGHRKSPNIQELWTQKHTDNFEAIKQ